MANQLIIGRALDQNGMIAPGAKATVYADGTSTLITVYSDVDGATPAANPIVADGDGFWPQRYVTEDAKAVVTTSADVALYTLDPAPTSQGTGAAASAVSFNPTISIPETNVQDAIEAAANLAVSGFAIFGLGITGNATLLAALDATGTGAGLYRFDGTTTGTYPTGVVAGDTGLVELWRQSASTAMMELHHATTNRVFRRRLTATVWGAWREEINVDQATARGDIARRGASAWERLALGAAGQVLQSDGTDTVWGGGAGLIFLLNANLAGANVTTVQDFFPQDVTLDASSIYEYELVTALTKSAGVSTHAIETLFGGTATLNAITRHYYTSTITGGGTGAATLLSNGYLISAAAFNMTGSFSGATAAFWLMERGFVSINASGTFIPQYRLTVAPGGAYSTVAGSYFRLRKLGASGANIAIGPWA